MRRQMPNLDAKMFDAPELRRESLDGLVRERAMQAAAVHQHLMVSDARLQTMFWNYRTLRSCATLTARSTKASSPPRA
ncbi:SurA N-terminal domain-containing protein [Roseateles sp. GG27B]